MQFLSLQGWAQNKPSKWLDICNDVKIINLKTRAYETFLFVFAVLLLIGATALIVSCSSDEDQAYNSEAKEYAYTPEEMQKIQTFVDEYEVSLPGLVTNFSIKNGTKSYSFDVPGLCNISSGV